LETDFKDPLVIKSGQLQGHRKPLQTPKDVYMKLSLNLSSESQKRDMSFGVNESEKFRAFRGGALLEGC